LEIALYHTLGQLRGDDPQILLKTRPTRRIHIDRTKQAILDMKASLDKAGIANQDLVTKPLLEGGGIEAFLQREVAAVELLP